jgi:hypothetical protein
MAQNWGRTGQHIDVIISLNDQQHFPVASADDADLYDLAQVLRDLADEVQGYADDRL